MSRNLCLVKPDQIPRTGREARVPVLLVNSHKGIARRMLWVRISPVIKNSAARVLEVQVLLHFMI